MSVQSIIVPTPKSALPQHEGRPIPWITRWTGELVRTPYSISVGREDVRLSYEDGNENRDPNGLLWKREGLGRGGSPEYSQVNTYRQRASMRKRLCQVCGSKINERPIRWLMPAEQLNLDEDGTAITSSAPTCASCIPLALELCPYLKASDYLILKVLDYEPWGVYGQAVAIDREEGKGRDLRGVYVPYENPPIELSAVCAFQEVVRLTKYVVEEEG